MQINGIKSSADFVKEIDRLVKVKNMEYFEAVMHYCESNDIEVETVASLVKQNSALKSKIQLEAEKVNLVKKGSARLPI